MKKVLHSVFAISLLLITSAALGQSKAVILESTFDSDLGNWTHYSIEGDQVWEWADYGNPPGCAKMTGYDGEQFANEDWIVSPVMDLSSASGVTLNFDEAINYEGGSIEDNEEIYISTNYSGSGNPMENGDWTELNVTGRASGSSWDFVPVDEVDLSGYEGESTVYLAFRYLSTNDNAATWEFDNIMVETSSTEPMIEVTSPNGGEVWEQGSTHDIIWTSENFQDNVKIELTGSNAEVLVESMENTGSYTWEIPGDQTIADDYKVKVSDAADGSPMDESDATFSIIAEITYVHQETFDEDLGAWTQYSVTGDQVWEWAEQYGDPPGCAKMSGYDGEPLENDDWLISPALNLDEYTNEILTFVSACNYDGPNLELYYSTDYDGSSDPSTQGAWTDITGQAEWSTGGFTWVESGNVSLSEIQGESVYLAFVYHSSPEDDAKTWEVDNIEITGVGDVGLEDEIANEVNIYSTNEQIIVNAPVNGDITVYNLMGQKITSANNFAGELTRINMEGYRGYYIVKWTNGKSLATKKVMVY